MLNLGTVWVNLAPFTFLFCKCIPLFWLIIHIVWVVFRWNLVEVLEVKSVWLHVKFVKIVLLWEWCVCARACMCVHVYVCDSKYCPILSMQEKRKVLYVKRTSTINKQSSFDIHQKTKNANRAEKKNSNYGPSWISQCHIRTSYLSVIGSLFCKLRYK